MAAESAAFAAAHAVLFALYSRTLYPTITGGDAGELLTTTCTLGAAHPPGYPLWTMSAALFAKLVGVFRPDTEQAYRVNLYSSVLSTLGSLLLTVCAYRLVRRIVFRGEESARARVVAAAAGLLGALCCFTSLTIWEYAVQGEVFALNNMLTSLLLFTAVEHYLRGQSTHTAMLGALVSGVCLSNQHTTVVYVVPIALQVAATAVRRGGDVFLLVALGLCGLAGMSFYLFLPWSAANHRLDGWGAQQTLEGFLKHLLRQEYGTFQLASDVGEAQDLAKILRRNGVFITRVLLGELRPLAVPLSLPVGFAALLRADARRCGAYMLPLLFVLYNAFMNTLANLTFSSLHLSILARMWMQNTVLAALLAAVGVGQIAKTLLCRAGAAPAGSFAKRGAAPRPAARAPALSRGALSALLLTSLAAVAWQVQRTLPSADGSRALGFSLYGRALLGPLAPSALLLVNDDTNCNVPQYLNRCEAVRPDVQVLRLPLITWRWWAPQQLSHYPTLRFPGALHHPHEPDGFHMAQFLAENMPSRNGLSAPPSVRGPLHPSAPSGWHGAGIYLAGDWKEGDSSADQAGFQRVPLGLADRVLPPGGEAPENLQLLVGEMLRSAPLLLPDAPEDVHLKARRAGRGWLHAPAAPPAAAEGPAAGAGGGRAMAAEAGALRFGIEGSWERVVFDKVQTYFARAAHFLAERAEREMPLSLVMASFDAEGGTVTYDKVGVEEPGARAVVLALARELYLRSAAFEDTAVSALLDERMDGEDAVRVTNTRGQRVEYRGVDAATWRNAGVVCGLLARELRAMPKEMDVKEVALEMMALPALGESVEQAKGGDGEALRRRVEALFASGLDEESVAKDMFRFWQRYIEAAALRRKMRERELRDHGASSLEVVDDAATDTIRTLLRDRVNPYVGERYEQWAWVTVPP